MELDMEKIMKFSLTAAILVALTASFLVMNAAFTLSQAADEILVLDDSAIDDVGDNTPG
jgi:hypothetical protein